MSEFELPAADSETKAYQRAKLRLGLAGLVAGLGWLTFWALWLGPRLGPYLQGSLGSPWLELFVVAAGLLAGVELLTLPLDFFGGYVLEHRYGLSNQTVGGWIRRKLKGYLVGGILGGVILAGLYALLWHGGEHWWLWATAGWLVLTLVLGRLLPVLILPLFYKTTPLDDPNLRTRLEKLAAGTGLRLEGVYRLHLSAETKKANAALAGMGRSRRVLLGDTLLDEFTPEEIEVVFAHEVGHHVHRHLPQMIVLRVLTTLGGLWLVDRLLHYGAGMIGYRDFRDPAALPLVLLVLTLFGLLLVPMLNGISRYWEHQCDAYALERTGNPGAYRSAFIKLARMNRSDPDPHPLIVLLAHDHPAIRDRLARADQGRKDTGAAT